MPFNVPEAEVARLLGYPAGRRLEGEVRALAEEARLWCQRHAAPTVRTRVQEITQLGASEIAWPMVERNSASSSRNAMTGAWSRRMARSLPPGAPMFSSQLITRTRTLAKCGALPPLFTTRISSTSSLPSSEPTADLSSSGRLPIVSTTHDSSVTPPDIACTVTRYLLVADSRLEEAAPARILRGKRGTLAKPILEGLLSC